MIDSSPMCAHCWKTMTTSVPSRDGNVHPECLEAVHQAYEEHPSTDLCRDCAADCCRAFTFVQVYDDDPTPRDLTVFDQLAERQRMKWSHHRQCCIALRGNRCAIYAQRPLICRAFEPGGDGCMEARRRMAVQRAAAALGHTSEEGSR